MRVLVNAAGGDVVQPFLDSDELHWRRMIDLKYISVLRAVKAVLPGMIQARAGAIVSVTSEAAKVGSRGEAPYAAGKAAVEAFSKSLAREVAGFGITVNCVAPGPTDTPQLRRNARGAGASVVESLARAIPARRLGEPAEIAAAVSYFASPAAAFATGQSLNVGGGLTM